jgi:hypothetical protein
MVCSRLFWVVGLVDNRLVVDSPHIVAVDTLPAADNPLAVDIVAVGIVVDSPLVADSRLVGGIRLLVVVVVVTWIPLSTGNTTIL